MAVDQPLLSLRWFSYKTGPTNNRLSSIYLRRRSRWQVSLIARCARGQPCPKPQISSVNSGIRRLWSAYTFSACHPDNDWRSDMRPLYRARDDAVLSILVFSRVVCKCPSLCLAVLAVRVHSLAKTLKETIPKS